MPNIQHVNLMVDDLEAAVDFYVTILGFPKTTTPELGFPAQFVAVGQHCELHINEIEDLTPVRAHFCVYLDDFNTVFHRAHRAGVIDVETWGLARRLPTGTLQAFVRDPAGNLIEIAAASDYNVDPEITRLDVFDDTSL